MIGTIEPSDLFTRRAKIDLPEDTALPLKLFIVWLVLLLWKRNSDGAGSGAGGDGG